MYYFVPAWYGTDRIWQQTATPWYWMRESIEFDDTINQVRIFQEAEMDLSSPFPAVVAFLPQHFLYDYRFDSYDLGSRCSE